MITSKQLTKWPKISRVKEIYSSGIVQPSKTFGILIETNKNN